MKSLLIALAAALLVGCAPYQVIKYKYVSEEVPDSLIQNCSATAPPAREQYNASSWEQKEALLSKSLQGTYKGVAQCNSDKAALREWKTRQAKIKADLEAKQAK